MALKDTIKHLKDLIGQITHDIEKADGGNKAASQRVRTATVKLEKVAKAYRKESIKHEKTTKGTKKPGTKKPAAKKAAHKPAAHHGKAHAKPAAHGKAHAKQPAKKPAAKAKTLKAKPKAKAHKAKARLLSFKKPSAKLLTKRSFR